MSYCVYIQAPDGTPLMPTKRFGKVRRLLRDGKARVVYRKPFTIRLLEEPSGRIKQEIVLGIDPGRTNIGLAAIDDKGNCVFRAKLTTRNKEIKKLMKNRKQHRQASRRGERLARKRLAKKYHTTTNKYDEKGRLLHGCAEPLMVKDIINTESRFNNRKRPKGWLTPSARQLLQTHISAIKLIKKILPISGIALEINKFSFMELDAGHHLFAEDYQNGKLKGYLNRNDAVYTLQNGKCLLCAKRNIEHYHHIVPRHLNGSESIDNIAGLCKKCHELVHTSKEAKERLSELKDGMKEKYAGVSLLNIIIPFLVDEIHNMYPDSFYPTMGVQTAEYRDKYNLPKDHDIDAYVIACVGTDIVNTNYGTETCEMLQYRNHDRAIIKAQTERIYYFGKEAVAKNRKPRFEQTDASLLEWYNEQVQTYGAKEADIRRSLLTVKKSMRRYNHSNRILPGALFQYEGKTHIMSGQLSNGAYLRALGDKETNYPARKCTIARSSGGILFT